MSRSAQVAAAVAVTMALLLPAGCIRLPEDGPVVETQSTGDANDAPGIYIDPRPPQDGASASEVVKGFLDAMTATPIQTNVAKQFLAKETQASWNPELETITYADSLTPQGSTRVSVRLIGANRLDARGTWQGPLTSLEQILPFPMVLEDGQWRIAQAPNALIVPESWFEQRFRQLSLYFFDPTGQVLVPEPVFVPLGEQLATTLVKGLLKGPGDDLNRVSTSFLPAGLSVGLSVPVSAGIADISLTGDAGQQTTQAIELMIAQLAWTLRQDPAIEALRVSIGGQPIQLPGGVSEFSVDEGSEYDPNGFQSSGLLYGLRDGLLVAGHADSLAPLDSPLGVDDYGLRSIAVNLTATTVAGVAADGQSLLEAPVRGPEDGVTQVVSGATDLLRPAWDFTDRLWLVDRTADGALVSYLENHKPKALEIPGVSGRKVRSFLISRDGSRLMAVVHRMSGDALMVSRIRYDDQGRVLRATRAERISWEGGAQLNVLDIGWRSPTTIAVLHRLTKDLSQVRTIAVDGAPTGLESLTTTLRGRWKSLAASPVASESLYAVTGSTLKDLSSATGGTTDLELGPGVSMLGYVG